MSLGRVYILQPSEEIILAVAGIVPCLYRLVGTHIYLSLSSWDILFLHSF